MALLGLDIKIPSYTQICRKAKGLKKVLQKLSRKRPQDIVFDSTGLKVYGEGEWKVKQHAARSIEEKSLEEAARGIRPR